MRRSLLTMAVACLLADSGGRVALGASTSSGKPESGYRRPSSRPRPYKRAASPAERVLKAAQERGKGGAQ